MKPLPEQYPYLVINASDKATDDAIKHTLALLTDFGIYQTEVHQPGRDMYEIHLWADVDYGDWDEYNEQCEALVELGEHISWLVQKATNGHTAAIRLEREQQ